MNYTPTAYEGRKIWDLICSSLSLCLSAAPLTDKAPKILSPSESQMSIIDMVIGKDTFHYLTLIDHVLSFNGACRVIHYSVCVQCVIKARSDKVLLYSDWFISSFFPLCYTFLGSNDVLFETDWQAPNLIFTVFVLNHIWGCQFWHTYDISVWCWALP